MWSLDFFTWWSTIFKASMTLKQSLSLWLKSPRNRAGLHLSTKQNMTFCIDWFARRILSCDCHKSVHSSPTHFYVGTVTSSIEFIKPIHALGKDDDHLQLRAKHWSCFHVSQLIWHPYPITLVVPSTTSLATVSHMVTTMGTGTRIMASCSKRGVKHTLGSHSDDRLLMFLSTHLPIMSPKARAN
jgi:hypothetical protein